MDIDIQWERAENYALRNSLIYFETPDIQRTRRLRNSIFEYMRKRHLNLDYSETTDDIQIYCFQCLAWLPKFHFC